MRTVTGVVQHYAWGDATFLPHLLGMEGTLEADGRPWAELWLGTHPGGPAHVADGRSLSAVAGELPYLLKVLAQDTVNPMLAPGEIVTTGTLTRAFPVSAGERWSTRIDGLPLPGLDVILA